MASSIIFGQTDKTTDNAIHIPLILECDEGGGTCYTKIPLSSTYNMFAKKLSQEFGKHLNLLFIDPTGAQFHIIDGATYSEALERFSEQVTNKGLKGTLKLFVVKSNSLVQAFIHPTIPRKKVGCKYEWCHYQKLGAGGQASVYFGLLESEGNKVVAVKQVNVTDKKCFRESDHEIQILSKLRHENIISIYGFDQIADFPDDSDFDSDEDVEDDKNKPKRVVQNFTYLFLEYMNGGSLFVYIAKPRTLSQDTIKNYSHQILKAIAYLHSQGVIHRDVKTANVLMSADRRTLKLTDFGISKFFNQELDKLKPCHTVVGTMSYMAPEIFKYFQLRNQTFWSNGDADKIEVSYDNTVDIWSFGCTVFEMVTGNPPDFSSNMMTDGIPVENLLKDFEHTNFLSGILNTCLQIDPKKRTSCEKLLANSYFPQQKPTPKPLPKPSPNTLLSHLPTFSLNPSAF